MRPSWGHFEVVRILLLASQPRLVKEPPSGRASLLARLCAFRKPGGETVPFEISVWMARKEGESFCFQKCAGEVGSPIASILSETAGAREEMRISSTA
jgi:hypothetical protein